MTPEQEISRDFFFKSLDKIDFYWHFLVLGIAIFIGWLMTTDAVFGIGMKLTAMIGYACFAGMNLVALLTAYRAAEAASKDLFVSVETLELPELKKLADADFLLGRHRLVVWIIHIAMGVSINAGILLKTGEL